MQYVHIKVGNVNSRETLLKCEQRKDVKKSAQEKKQS